MKPGDYPALQLSRAGADGRSDLPTKCFEKLFPGYSDHANDARERSGGQRLSTMNGNRNREGVRKFDHHVVTAFDSIQMKSQLLERPNHLFPIGRRDIRPLLGA